LFGNSGKVWDATPPLRNAKNYKIYLAKEALAVGRIGAPADL